MIKKKTVAHEIIFHVCDLCGKDTRGFQHCCSICNRDVCATCDKKLKQIGYKLICPFCSSLKKEYKEYIKVHKLHEQAIEHSSRTLKIVMAKWHDKSRRLK